MWRSKKFIIGAVLAVVLIAGSIGGVALAADNGASDNQTGTSFGALWDKVGTIYEQKTGVALDQEALKESIAQAQTELRTEALQSRLQELVGQGKMSQEQADQYLKWWQAKPDISPGFGFKGFDRFRGMGGMRGFGFPCPPPSPPPAQ
jgi:outer membrane murein-binding lipoprotein Lpp